MGSDARTLINGRKDDHIGVYNRGLLYGDGLFETIAVLRGSLSLWSAHLQRLSRGCHKLGVVMPDEPILMEEAHRLIQQDSGVLKLILTRADGPRGYAPTLATPPVRMMQFFPSDSLPPSPIREPVQVRLCKTPLGLNPQLAGIKHLNRLEQVLARGEWQDDAIFEGLMLDIEGCVVEGTCSNLFLLEDAHLITPLLDRCGVAGVMRQTVMDVADTLGKRVQEERIDTERLFKADGLFLTNALWGCVPVGQVEDIDYDPARIDRALLREAWQRAFGSIAGV